MYRNFHNFERIFDIMTRNMRHEAFNPYSRHLRPRNYQAYQPLNYKYNGIQIETSKIFKDGEYLEKIKKTITNPDGSQDVYEYDINDKGYNVKQYRIADNEKSMHTTKNQEYKVNQKSDLKPQKIQEPNGDIKAENLKSQQKLSEQYINKKDDYCEIQNFEEFLDKFESNMRRPFDTFFDDTFSKGYRHEELNQASATSETEQHQQNNQQISPELDKSGSYSFSREVIYNEDGSHTVKEYYEDIKGQKTKEYKIIKDTKQQKPLEENQQQKTFKDTQQQKSLLSEQ